MKKSLGLFSAAALIAAATASPAMAADVELSGEVRIRHEITNNNDYMNTADDSRNETQQRTRLNAKVAVDDKTTVFISLQDSRNWGDESPSASDPAGTQTTGNEGEAVDISQAYLLINDIAGPVDLIAGRIPLSFGNQRIIGSFEWAMGRRFDGFGLLYGNDTVDATLYFSNVLEPDSSSASAHANGLNVVIKNVIPVNTLDVYHHQLTAPGDFDQTTTGLRLAGKTAGADWTAEYAKQGGDDDATTEIDASLLAVTGGYTLDNVLGGLRIGGEFFAVSGQDTSADRTSFDNSQATNHFHYGILDGAQGNGNLDGIAIKLDAKPFDGVKVGLQHWMMEENEVSGSCGATTACEFTETNAYVKTGLSEKTKLYVYVAQGDVDVSGSDKASKVGIQISAAFN